MSDQRFGPEELGQLKKRIIAWVRTVAASEALRAGKFSTMFDPETKRMAVSFALEEKPPRAKKEKLAKAPNGGGEER